VLSGYGYYATSDRPFPGMAGKHRNLLEDVDFVSGELAHEDRQLTLYWPGHAREIWFHLNANSYFDVLQSAGGIFERATSLEAKRRGRLVRRFEIAEFWRDGAFRRPGAWRLMEFLEEGKRRSPRFADLKRLCLEPMLDYVIVRQNFEHRYLAKNPRWFLYSCRSLFFEEWMQSFEPKPEPMSKLP